MLPTTVAINKYEYFVLYIHVLVENEGMNERMNE
jgi:hypothetical protein